MFSKAKRKQTLEENLRKEEEKLEKDREELIKHMDKCIWELSKSYEEAENVYVYTIKTICTDEKYDIISSYMNNSLSKIREKFGVSYTFSIEYTPIYSGFMLSFYLR